NGALRPETCSPVLSLLPKGDRVGQANRAQQKCRQEGSPSRQVRPRFVLNSACHQAKGSLHTEFPPEILRPGRPSHRSPTSHRTAASVVGAHKAVACCHTSTLRLETYPC